MPVQPNKTPTRGVFAVHAQDVQLAMEAVDQEPGTALLWVRPLMTSRGEPVQGVMQLGVSSSRMSALALKAWLGSQPGVRLCDLSKVYAFGGSDLW